MGNEDYNMGGNQSVRVAAAISQVANDQFNDYVNEVINNGDSWDIPHLYWLRDRADAADKRLDQARHDALNTCTCDPHPNREGPACIVCQNRAREQHGDAIPWKFGSQEPPDDPRIFNRRQPDGSYRPLSEFFDEGEL